MSLAAASLPPARQDETPLRNAAVRTAALDPDARARVCARAADLVRRIRRGGRPGLMEVFLAEYGLSTDEGIALMCLAEALLRVPDAPTMDALIEDKIAPSDWGRHLGHSASPLVNASTWALMLTGKVLDDGAPGAAGHLRAAVRRLGEPVIRRAVARAMREMGRQFVLGETIGAALERARTQEARGYSYSYDMLGEAARTEADARRYLAAYGAAIEAIGQAAQGKPPGRAPGISVKLSALHPRYEEAQRGAVLETLAPRLAGLARQARAAGIGLTVDAEEADRLELSLDVAGAALADPDLAGWDGFGMVVQAYGLRAGAVIAHLDAVAAAQGRRIMVRLVKGAYWDTEIKRAQVLGLHGFPVFTHKAATDAHYIACARELLQRADRLYPQFATHNAHTVAAVREIAQDEGRCTEAFEFQRLHGMGERLHDIVMAEAGTRCRIYAPVGAHRDLLAYLVRRLLENGANSSFVNQIVDKAVPPETVAACPLSATEALPPGHNAAVKAGPDLFAPVRPNARGRDLSDRRDLAAIERGRAPLRSERFAAAPVLAGQAAPLPAVPVTNPSDPDDMVGTVQPASAADIATALDAAAAWDVPPEVRRDTLWHAADLLEAREGAVFAILAREAGKTLSDALGELREAADFLRHYGAEAVRLRPGPRGTIACISPWNFPLAIFLGQVAGALAAGNAVLAKPAEQTPLIAALGVAVLHEAGVPRSALQLLPGDGATTGAALTRDPRVAGVVFTGSTETARAIRRSMAEHLDPGAPLVAETGGLNAMIVDSTALPEQAVRDVLASAFQSAGQRCSALRCLYVQRDIAPAFLTMLTGAMETLRIGDPWGHATDIGPVIDAAAAADIRAHIGTARAEGRIVLELAAPGMGHFVGPTVLRVNGIADIPREVFGPVLHVATFPAGGVDAVIDAVNARGYGLTFGLHSRIDDRVQHVADRVAVGNLYVNRNQIGAVVGSQPFGGEGLSGTGPKAGGDAYVARLGAPRPAPPQAGMTPDRAELLASAASGRALADLMRAAVAAAPPAGPATDLPGPTGESNRLSLRPRGPVLCMGPGAAAARAQAEAVEALGGRAVVAPVPSEPETLRDMPGLAAALWWGDAQTARAIVRALAARPGAIVPLVTAFPDAAHVLLERHVCVDTTASGGNAALLAAVGG